MRKFILAAAMTTALVTGIVTQHASAVDSGDWVADNSCPVVVGTKANRVCFYRTRTAGINVNANVSTRDSAHSDNFYSTGNVINNAANDVTNGFSSTTISLCNGFNYLNAIQNLSPGFGTTAAPGTSSYRNATSGCV